MKKIILLSSMLSLVFLVSCAKKTETDTIVEKDVETVVVPGETQTVTSPTTEAKNPDGTSVSFGKNGVSVNTKNGSNSTQINMSKDSSRVIIKK